MGGTVDTYELIAKFTAALRITDIAYINADGRREGVSLKGGEQIDMSRIDMVRFARSSRFGILKDMLERGSLIKIQVDASEKIVDAYATAFANTPNPDPNEHKVLSVRTVSIEPGVMAAVGMGGGDSQSSAPAPVVDGDGMAIDGQDGISDADVEAAEETAAEEVEPEAVVEETEEEEISRWDDGMTLLAKKEKIKASDDADFLNTVIEDPVTSAQLRKLAKARLKNL